MADGSRNLDKVVHIDVSEPELMRRLGSRFICRVCQAPHDIGEGEGRDNKSCVKCGGELYQRDDDRPEALKKRFEVYKKETMPVLGFYRERGVLVNVPGDDTINEVNKQVMAALGA